MKFLSACKAFWEVFTTPKDVKKIDTKSMTVPVAKPQVSHLRFLSLLQKQGRLVDFLKEDLSAYSDNQVGAAVRKIHADCSQQLEEWVTLRPIMVEEEGAKVTVAANYDRKTVKIIGKVKGEPPYKGILRHKGWRAHKIKLPEIQTDIPPEMIMQAEIEVE